jgi:hypothetical protein
MVIFQTKSGRQFHTISEPKKEKKTKKGKYEPK